MTALTLYLTNSASSSLSTACKLVSAAGGGLTNKNTKIGTSIHYGEVYSQGTTNSWPALASIPDPSGHGWIWEDTTLADSGGSFNAGTWTITLRLNVSVNSISANLYLRTYRRASNGTYNPITTLSLTSQTVTSSEASFTFSSTTGVPSDTFQSGDLLYIDNPVNILTNSTGSSSASLKTNVANSSTLGNIEAQLVTPGYSIVVATSRDAAMRMRLSAVMLYDAAMRFRTQNSAVESLHDAAMRFRMRGAKSYDASMRMRLSNTRSYDAAMRFRTQNNAVASSYDATMRFRVIGEKDHDAAMRFRTADSQSHDAAMRFRLSPYGHHALFPPATRRTGQFPSTSRRQSV